MKRQSWFHLTVNISLEIIFESLKKNRLFANLTNADSNNSDGGGIDFLSNGFKVRTNDGSTNESGVRIYMAFAENPFVTSGGIPVTAR